MTFTMLYFDILNIKAILHALLLSVSVLLQDFEWNKLNYVYRPTPQKIVNWKYTTKTKNPNPSGKGGGI